MPSTFPIILLHVSKLLQALTMEILKMKEELKKPHPHYGVFPCDICPPQLSKRGEVIERVMKRKLELRHQKEANVRQVKLEPIIKVVAEEVVGMWGKGLSCLLGNGLHNKTYRIMWGMKLKIGNSRKE